jgi:hypothetical protein
VDSTRHGASGDRGHLGEDRPLNLLDSAGRAYLSVQPLQDHDQPSRDHRPISRHEPLRRQLAVIPGVFSDYPALVIREADGGLELTMIRWGMPPPPRTGGPPVTNIRNTSSPHWRMWLKRENRCRVPFQ